MNEERLIDLRIKALDLAMDTPMTPPISERRTTQELRAHAAQTYLNFLCTAQPAPVNATPK